MRSLYLLGFLYAALCAGLLLRARHLEGSSEPVAQAPAFTGAASDWFQQVKPFCNTLEVETHVQQAPPPPGAEGAGFGAACYALAGQTDRAREMILALPGADKSLAASIVFNIGHPVADAGDDRSAGPIMELVLEFQPENYMALYHAGISEYALGQTDKARSRLHQFLELYHDDDGWRSNAVEVLGRMEGTEP